MKLLESINSKVMGSQRLEGLVRQYGAEKISTYSTSAAAFGIAVLGGSALTVGVAVPVIAGLVSFVNKLEHDYKERDLLESYREQIAAVKGEADCKKIDVSDLRNFAEGRNEFARFGSNPLLKQELQNYKKKLNLSLITHAASAAMFAVIAIAATALAPILGSLETLSPMISSLGVGAAALLVYDQIDGMNRGISDMLCPEKKTAQSDVKSLEESLHKGDKVRPLKVYSILVKSSPQAQKRIKEQFGAAFDDLYLSQKNEAMLLDAKKMPLGEITQSLNEGRLEAEDIVLVLGNNPPLRDPEVAQRLRRFHHYRDQAEASVMPASPPPQPQQAANDQPMFGKKHESGHVLQLEKQRIKIAQAEIDKSIH